MTEQHVNNFLRQWIRRKPAALSDFYLYRNAARSYDLKLMSKEPTMLLAGIPGPANTPWEGGLFPLKITWRVWNHPPLCQFPPGFHHVNIYPSGTVGLTTLNMEEGWTPLVTLPEMLFSIQALLAHPNSDSPAQRDAYHCYMKSKDDYDAKGRELATTYCASGDFLANAKKVFGEEHLPKVLSLVDDGQSSYDDGSLDWVQRKVIPPAKISPPELPGVPSCRCSCCAWGTTFWDEAREMRHLFGS